MILLPFHTDTPCEPHYSGCVGSAAKGMRLISCGGAYPSSLERCCMLFILGQGLTITPLTSTK